MDRRCCAAVLSLYVGSYRGLGIGLVCMSGAGLVNVLSGGFVVLFLVFIGLDALHMFSVRCAILAVMGLCDFVSLVIYSLRLDGMTLCSVACSI